ncbi:MAG: hypothetical protein LUF78_01875 [Clostridiales bacterium]|nr:hypothetical protein [Clostridiales bacterium]
MFRGYLIPMTRKLRQAAGSPRVQIGYGYGLWLGISMGLRYIAFSGGLEIGIFESFLMMTNDIFNLSLLLIGFFIIIADAPFIDAETYYVLIRSGGTPWRISMAGYILVQLFFYEILILLGGMLPGLLRGGFTPGWSETMKVMAGASLWNAAAEYDLTILDPWMFSTWSAPEALMHSFCLVTLYGFLLGMIGFTGNLNKNLPLGNLAAVGVHFVGMLVLSGFIPLYRPSMAAHCILQYHISGREVLSLAESYFLYFFCICFIFLILKRISRNTDYQTAVSQRLW